MSGGSPISNVQRILASIECIVYTFGVISLGQCGPPPLIGCQDPEKGLPCETTFLCCEEWLLDDLASLPYRHLLPDLGCPFVYADMALCLGMIQHCAKVPSTCIEQVNSILPSESFHDAKTIVHACN